MDQDRWQQAQFCSDHLSAEVIAAWLRDAGIPVRIVDAGALPGLEFGSRVLVPVELLHRASWMLKQLPVSDSELDALARSGQPE
ncbi:MAG TPA: hypothetical protein VHE37_05570 [Nevskiaceae bacterium]|nr:hypothetical protein [Nevskiaceae bacterium]